MSEFKSDVSMSGNELATDDPAVGDEVEADDGITVVDKISVVDDEPDAAGATPVVERAAPAARPNLGSLIGQHLQVVVGVGVVVAVLAGVLVYQLVTAPSLCGMLAAHPSGLTSMQVVDDNGTIDDVDAPWFALLTEGVRSATDESRLAMATAVADDPESAEVLLAQISPSDRPAVERLQGLVADPELGRASSTGPATDQDIRTLVSLRGDAGCS